MQRLLTSKINWNEYRFAGAGEPIPVIKKGGDVYAAAQQEKLEIEQSMEPISATKLAVLLYTLQAHYWLPNMSEGLLKEVVKDYLRLLGHYPLDAFEQVRDEILMQKDREFVPKLGELNDMLAAKLYRKKYMLTALAKLLEKAE